MPVHVSASARQVLLQPTQPSPKRVQFRNTGLDADLPGRQLLYSLPLPAFLGFQSSHFFQKAANVGFQVRSFLRFPFDFGQRMLKLRRLSLPLPRLLPRQLFEGVVVGKVQYVGEDFLALLGGAEGELVGPTLAKKGAVDEGLVFKTQELADLGLGLGDGVPGDGPELPPTPRPRNLKLQHARPRPPAPGPFPLPYHPVHVLPVGEFQLHLHVRFTDVNKVVDSPSPRLSPQCPGHRIQQRRFTVAVVAADTGYVDPSRSSGSGTSR